MFTRDDLALLDRLGFGSDVEKLEEYVASLQEYASSGEPKVSDDVYDTHFKLLSKLKPESAILNRNWESVDRELEGDDILLKEFGMRSIRTIKDMSELSYFVNSVLADNKELDLLVSTKLNGHAIRAVYRYGSLVSGSTRGRYKKGRDITRHLKQILPNHVVSWEKEPYIEIRGEMLVSYENFKKVSNYLKTPLSAVTSCIKESATEEEISLLSVVCYRLLKYRDSVTDNGSETLLDEFKELDKNGFSIPRCTKLDAVNKENFMEYMDIVVDKFGAIKNELDYDTDGIVVSVNDNNIFYNLGLDGNRFIGNFALKTGDAYGTKVYQSIIREIEWVYGKTYITPKAIIEPTKTANGAEVRVVPLYNIGMMEKLHLIPNERIYFTFGGETGVSLCDSMGNKIS